MYQSVKIPIENEIHNYSDTNKYFLPIYEKLFFFMLKEKKGNEVKLIKQFKMFYVIIKFLCFY